MRTGFSLSIIVFSISWLNAQTFEVDQIDQLFRPRLKADSKYIFDSRFMDTSGVFNQKEAGVVFTFPIKTNVSADIKLDFQSLKLKDILKNSVRIKASQLLGVLRVNGRQTAFGFDAAPHLKNTVSVTAGLMGLRLTKKYRVMFYSAGVSLAEQDKTISAAVPRAGALLGQLHVRGLKKNFFYGMAASYSDGLLLPAVFFGGSQPVGDRFVFNYTLPVQINVQYRDNKKTLITAGINADGYRTGINYNGRRLNVNYTSVVGYANIRYRFSRTFEGKLEGGYILYQNLKYSNAGNDRAGYRIGTGPYVQAGFNVLFGRTVWEKILQGVSVN